MKRRAFLGTLGAGLLTGPLGAGAQLAGKVYRVGYLAASSPSAENTRLVGAFQAELRERGWVEGQNIAIEWRWAQGKDERFPDLAAEFVKLKEHGVKKIEVLFTEDAPGGGPLRLTLAQD